MKFPPADVETFTGLATGLVKSRVKMLALVLIAGSGSRFSVKTSSLESGAKAKPPPPSSEKGGTSWGSLGVRSRTAPVSTEARKRWLRLSPV